jgi:hypothetical protein
MTIADGSQQFTIRLDKLLPAAGLLKGPMTGEFAAPAIHFDVPWRTDVWLFLLRSPWFPLKLELEKTELSVAHADGRATASIRPTGDARLSVDVSLAENTFKRVSLVMRRSLGSFSSEELIGELVAGGRRGSLDRCCFRSYGVTSKEPCNVTRTYGRTGRGQGQSR